MNINATVPLCVLGSIIKEVTKTEPSKIGHVFNTKYCTSNIHAYEIFRKVAIKRIYYDSVHKSTPPTKEDTILPTDSSSTYNVVYQSPTIPIRHESQDIYFPLIVYM